MEVLQLNPWTALWKHAHNVDKSVGFFFLSATRKSSRIYFAPPLILIHYLRWALWKLCWETYLCSSYKNNSPWFRNKSRLHQLSSFFFMLASSFFLFPWRGYLQKRWNCGIDCCHVWGKGSHLVWTLKAPRGNTLGKKASCLYCSLVEKVFSRSLKLSRSEQVAFITCYSNLQCQFLLRGRPGQPTGLDSEEMLDQKPNAYLEKKA